MSVAAATYTYLRKDTGGVARTVEAGDGFHVDLDDQDRIIGVETYGDDTDWRNGLAALAMTGRLTVPRRPA